MPNVYGLEPIPLAHAHGGEMTREELKILLLKNPLSLDHDAIWRHDQAQREEIARLREALEFLMEEKIDYMRLNNLGNAELTHSVTLARQALAKEATRDTAK